jgi:uncharacterized protein (DUF3820 family)
MIDFKKLNESLKENMYQRELAELCFDQLVIDNGEAKPRFWEVIIELAQQQIGATPQTGSEASMTDDEARRFGKQTITFGKFQGKPIDEVPIDYLEWYVDSQQFAKDVAKYLQSQRIRSER